MLHITLDQMSRLRRSQLLCKHPKTDHYNFLCKCRKAWKALGTMSHEEAQSRVVELLEGVCPGLKEVVLNDVKEEQRLRELQQRHKENGYYVVGTYIVMCMLLWSNVVITRGLI